MLDAAGVILDPPKKVRQATSPDFVGPESWMPGRTLKLSQLTNGFHEALPNCVTVTLEPSTVRPDRTFRLKATNIPAEAVGVYKGTADLESSPEGDGVAVWLVIP